MRILDDRVVGAGLFNANTAADAQKLGDEGNFVGGFDFYAQFACTKPVYTSFKMFQSIAHPF
jgi:beta-xylosidase